jgi:hypothetical protein
MAQIFVGIIAEGTTDYRFLESIIEKTLVEIVFECVGQIDVDVKVIECEKGNSFNEYVLNGAQKGHQEYGITMLIVHADADSSSASNTYNNKINPAIVSLNNQSNHTHCKQLAALVPIQETEAWMLADKNILIKQIGTKKSEAELNINGNPETINNPKERIEEAIRIGRLEMPKKLKDSLKLSDLYSYLGQAIQVEKLKALSSFQDFETNIRKVLVDLNLLQPNN